MLLHLLRGAWFGQRGVLANGSRLTEEWLNEAKRVAREKIIIKAHFRDTVFEELGFERQIRPNQKLHYGVMDLSEGH